MSKITINSFSDFTPSDDVFGFRFLKLSKGQLEVVDAEHAKYLEVWDIHNKHSYYDAKGNRRTLVLYPEGFKVIPLSKEKMSYMERQQLGTDINKIILPTRQVVSNILINWKAMENYHYAHCDGLYCQVSKDLIEDGTLSTENIPDGYVKLWNGENDNIYDSRYYTYVPEDEVPKGYIQLDEKEDVYAPANGKNVVAIYEDSETGPIYYVSLAQAAEEYFYSDYSNVYWYSCNCYEVIVKFYPDGKFDTMSIPEEELDVLNVDIEREIDGFLITDEALEQAREYNLYQAYTDQIYDYHNFDNYEPLNLEDEDDDVYYGFEIETEGNLQNSCLIDNDGLLHCERDSSLRTGFEIVSQPMSWGYLTSDETKTFLKSLFEELKNKGQTADKESTCGLHIHVSVEAFKTDDSIERTKAIVAGFKDNFEKLARRKQNSYCGYLKVDGIKVKKKDIKKQFHGRYVAVNDTNDDTIEFRMFQSTLDYNTLMASIELVKNIIALANSDKKAIQFKELISEGEYLREYASKFKLKLYDVLDFSEWENELD